MAERPALPPGPARRDRERRPADPDAPHADVARGADPRRRAGGDARRLLADARPRPGRRGADLHERVGRAPRRRGPHRDAAAGPAGARGPPVRGAHVHAPVRAAGPPPGVAPRGGGLSGDPRGALRGAGADLGRRAPGGRELARRAGSGSGRGRVHARSDGLEPARELAGLYPDLPRRRAAPARGGRPPAGRALARGGHRVSQAVLRGRPRARARPPVRGRRRPGRRGRDRRTWRGGAAALLYPRPARRVTARMNQGMVAALSSHRATLGCVFQPS